MQTEFEVVFTSINREDIRQKIVELGGICTKKDTIMKRVIFDTGENSYTRIRDEGDKITCTYKEINSKKLDINSVKELETEVGDFEIMKAILEKSGIKQKAYQETKREVWEINGEIEIMLDIWPGLNPFIEIEGKNEELVKKYSKLLGFDYNKGVFGAVDQIAKLELGIPENILNSMSEITFDKPLVKYNK